MTRTLPLLPAIALLFTSLAPAAAQQAQSATAATNTAQQTPVPSYAAVLNAVPQNRAQIAQIMALNAPVTNDLRIVNVDGVIASDNGASLESALERNRAQLDALHRALGARTVTATTDNSRITVAQFLADNRIAISRVVGAQAQGRTLFLYIR
jgi:hypothetical protein